MLNRTQRRELVKRLKSRGYNDEQILTFIKMREERELALSFKEGDKVMLDIDAIMNDVNYDRKRSVYKLWVAEHANDVFTIEYDHRHKDNPSLVCLAEDKTLPKWLFYVGDLKKIEEG